MHAAFTSRPSFFTSCLRAAIPALALAAIGTQAAASTVSLLGNGDFETAFCSPLRVSGFTSAQVGQWAVGDPACSTAAVNGITPLGGSQMMEFSATGGVSSDVYQIVDVSAFAAQIDAGLVTVSWSASYNAVARAAAGLSLYRYTAQPTSFAGALYVAGSETNLTVDSDLATWQSFGLSDVALASGTRYLLAGLHSPTSGPKTYVDDASLTLTVGGEAPEPSTCALLLASGLAWWLGRRPRG